MESDGIPATGARDVRGIGEPPWQEEIRALAKTQVAGSRPAGAYSPGIIASGRFLYVSGQGPLRDGVVVGRTIEEQTSVTLENLGAVLEAAGAGPADVVRCGVFLADLADFTGMDAVYAGFFPQPLPARTTVGATLRDIKVEIDCVAVLPFEDNAETTA
jgi:2-iminobutanoate/2-iminopropanoate deaminase